MTKYTEESEEIEVIDNKDIEVEQRYLSSEQGRRTIEWQLFYLYNLDVFNRDYLGLKLKYFQKQMTIDTYYNEIELINASRGLSKSFCIGINAIDFALLLPNIKIGIVALTIEQSNKIISDKIDKIFTSPTSQIASPVLQQLRKDKYIEIKNTNTDSKKVVFGNGSEIISVGCNESSRGARLNIVIVDECAIIKKNDYYTIVEPMLEPYVFHGIVLEPKQIFLTSSKTKDNWVWTFLKKVVNNHYKHAKGVRYGFYAGDILTSIANGIHTKKQYITRRENTSEFEFMQEYMNIWQGESNDSLFKYEQFHALQDIENAFMPRTKEEVASGIENKYVYNDENHIRYIACDIALSSGDQNDNTVIVLGYLDTNTYEKYVEYIVSFNGVNSMEQVATIKRLFYEYRASYCVIDTKGVGLTLFDVLTVETLDNEYGQVYKAWTVSRDNEINISSDMVIADKVQRTIDKNAEEVVIAVAGTSEINSNMHLSMQKTLRDKKIHFLLDDYEKEYKQSSDEKWLKMFSEDRARIMLPFVETRLMINESVSLTTEYRNGVIKVSEKKSAYKDRYMALTMFNYFGEKLIAKYVKEESNYTDFNIDEWRFLAM